MNRMLSFTVAALALTAAIAGAALSVAFKLAAVACVAVLFVVGLVVFARERRRRP